MKNNSWVSPEISRKIIKHLPDISSGFKIYDVPFSFFFLWAIMKNNSLWINIYVTENSKNCEKAALWLGLHRCLRSRISKVSMLPWSELLCTNTPTDGNSVNCASLSMSAVRSCTFHFPLRFLERPSWSCCSSWPLHGSFEAIAKPTHLRVCCGTCGFIT